MNRIIKFRAWDKENRSMHPITALHSNGACHISVPRSVNDPMLSADEFVPMQFTGLKDRNGKEIYEGDVVKYSDYRVGAWKKEYEENYKYKNADVR